MKSVTAVFILIALLQEGIGYWLWDTSDLFSLRHEVGFDLMASTIITPLIWRLVIIPFT
jgi:hypothetical protein